MFFYQSCYLLNYQDSWEIWTCSSFCWRSAESRAGLPWFTGTGWISCAENSVFFFSSAKRRIFSDAPASLALIIVTHSLIKTGDWQFCMFDSSRTTPLVFYRLGIFVWSVCIFGRTFSLVLFCVFVDWAVFLRAQYSLWIFSKVWNQQSSSYSLIFPATFTTCWTDLNCHRKPWHL